MGATLSAAREAITQNDKEMEKQLNEQLDTLYDIAKTKADLFYFKLLTEENAKEFTVGKVKGLSIKTIADISNDSEKIGNEVGSAGKIGHFKSQQNKVRTTCLFIKVFHLAIKSVFE